MITIKRIVRQTVIIHLHDTHTSFHTEWESQSNTVAGMSSHRCVSHQHEILNQHCLIEYRAISVSQDELVPEWKLYQYHVNTPWEYCYLRLNGMLVHCRVTPSSMSPVTFYTPEQKETMWGNISCLRKYDRRVTHPQTTDHCHAPTNFSLVVH